VKIEHAPTADAMTIRLCAGSVFDSDEVRANVFLDLDPSVRVLRIEMLDVSL
jgi:uncharacterized protein YuzE